ncbi:RNA polymerase sigma factor [Riemerella columbina]|uniref:RNA polymerase sigma factor n=1 Tax=Riemerella columbina TaxID=103810 RepID=UPI00266F915A|nr:sigma-70 family RNA polymerase sigma factor [Riemerella columbina]WKS95208.1 sigma-70 family RNA polymerase sigma factor [Riemerella columbina]
MDIVENEIISLMNTPEHQEKGLRKMMDAFQERLYWHIRRLVVSHDTAQDVLQETFIKAYQNFSQFKKESKLYTWLYRIATNEALQELRKMQRKLQNESTLVDEMHHLVSNHTPHDADEVQRLLQQAIHTLPEKQKIVFTLRYYDDLPYEELSKMLNMSVGTLKTNYHYAKQKIEDYITAQHDSI